MLDAKVTVPRGVALLDEKGPSDWRSKIDPAKLRMFSFHGCVLGQLYGNFFIGKDALGIPDGVDGCLYGFDSAKHPVGTVQAEWERVLAEPRPTWSDVFREFLRRSYERLPCSSRFSWPRCL